MSANPGEPWKVKAWHAPPSYTWLESESSGDHAAADPRIRGLRFESEPADRRATQVFAWYGQPDGAHAVDALPAMVLIHGGGGRAFSEWVRLWVERGYAALAMDLGGCDLSGERHASAGPQQNHPAKFGAISGPLETHWCYHAAAAVIRAHSLLASFDAVDAKRIGMCGISWGGFLTCLTAGLDTRWALAIPVYGCGFIHENGSVDWLAAFAAMSHEDRARWIAWYEPSRHLAHSTCPMLFVNGTNDFAYPLDSFMKTFALPRGPRQLCVRVNMEHGHEHGWTAPEPYLFADHWLRGSPSLPCIEALRVEGARCSAQVRGNLHACTAPQWHDTQDAGPWRDRTWHSRPAQCSATGLLSANCPATTSCTAGFFSIQDTRGALISSEVWIPPASV